MAATAYPTPRHAKRAAPVQLPIVAFVNEVGLLAMLHGREERAEEIFAAIRPCLADGAALDVSRALVHYLRKEHDRAERLLHDVLAREPQHEVAKASLGLLMRDAGRDGWRAVFEHVLAVGINPQARAVAQAALAN